MDAIAVWRTQIRLHGNATDADIFAVKKPCEPACTVNQRQILQADILAADKEQAAAWNHLVVPAFPVSLK